jgi:hypothetical protein
MKLTQAAVAAATAELKRVECEVRAVAPAISANKLYRLIQDIETSAYRDNHEAFEACRAVIKWYEGPEGPEMLFSQGCEMIKRVKEIVNDPK